MWVPRSGPRVRTGSSMLVVALLCGGLLGCVSPHESEDGPPSPDASAAVDAEFTDADLWLSFDTPRVNADGNLEFADDSDAQRAARVETANDGHVESVGGAAGRGAAVEFPAKCEVSAGCPRALLEVASDSSLNPGAGDFSFGASVWLAADQTSIGSNIVQKGRFGSAGGQWKLQIDGQDGQPSCVIRVDSQVFTIKASRTVADSAWHRIVCRRSSEGVAITVDGVLERLDGGQGSVDNEFAIRIASPGLGEADDQFHGRIDDVFVSIDQPLVETN